MSRVTKIYCNCCGNELTEGMGLNHCLFFTIITATKNRTDYCYECGDRIVSKMNEELNKIRKEKGILKYGDQDTLESAMMPAT